MLQPAPSILFVDDDPDVRKTAELLLKKAGYVFWGAATPEEAMSRLVSNPIDVILLDLNFTQRATSGQEGLECLRDILRYDPRALVIVVTGHSGLTIAVQALRSGASDFITKPWSNERLIKAIEGVLAGRKFASSAADDPSIMIGDSDTMKRITAAVDRCAALTVPVFLTGERGSGKTLAGTVLHRQSARTSIAHIDASMLTHGHLDETPDRTLLVENVENLDPGVATAFLTWLHGAPRRNSRVITTSVKGRSEIGIDRGLTYALCTVEISLLPLREKPDDIELLAEHFTRVACQLHGFPLKILSTEARALLRSHVWPDNVHELRHVIGSAVVMTEGSILSAENLAIHNNPTLFPEHSKPKFTESEKSLIEGALTRSNFNVSAAALELGLKRTALYRRMAKYGL